MAVTLAPPLIKTVFKCVHEFKSVCAWNVQAGTCGSQSTMCIYVNVYYVCWRGHTIFLLQVLPISHIWHTEKNKSTTTSFASLTLSGVHNAPPPKISYLFLYYFLFFPFPLVTSCWTVSPIGWLTEGPDLGWIVWKASDLPHTHLPPSLHILLGPTVFHNVLSSQAYK